MTEATQAVAAIDCGTNSTRILVADGSGKTLDRRMHITRLGQAVDATGRLAPEAIDRTVAVLREYRQTMDQFGVDRALPPGHAGPVPSGGVGGTRKGVKCLHAHFAWHLAGGDDPIGRWVAEKLG